MKFELLKMRSFRIIKYLTQNLLVQYYCKLEFNNLKHGSRYLTIGKMIIALIYKIMCISDCDKLFIETYSSTYSPKLSNTKIEKSS